MRQEVIDLLSSMENKKLDSGELDIIKRYIVTTFSNDQLFEILNFGIKNRFDKNEEELNLEIVSNYSLPIRIKNKIDLIDSLNYFHHCLSDNGEPCNKYVEERCAEASKVLIEVGNINEHWNENMKLGYNKIKMFVSKQEGVKDES